MSYDSCPACSSRSREATEHVRIFRCGRCGGIYGDCYLGDSYGIVSPYMTWEDVPPEQTRYFDFTCVGSRGVTRRHGWYDPETRLVVQAG